MALRLFPSLVPAYPELVARARLSSADHTPIDLATPAWRERPVSADPWQRVAANVERAGWEFLPIQRIDADYAIDRLNRGLGAYFGHEMGLGKTLASLMVIDGWPANYILIVCPSEAKQDPWVDHIKRFAPWLTPVVVGHSKADREASMAWAKSQMDAGQPTAVICHYQAVPLIEGPNKRGWKPLGRFDLMIVDEAHNLKGRSRKDGEGTKRRTSQTVAALKRIQAVGHLLLSGSVMSGNPEDLFTPWNIMDRKNYRAKWRDWNDPFMEVIDGDYGKIVVGPSIPALPRFRRVLGEKLVVRQARDYLQLPEPRVIEHSVELTRAQAKAYYELIEDQLTELPDGNIMEAEAGSSLLTGLRRVTGGISLADGKWESAKLARAIQLVRDAGDSQIVVFSWHKALIEEFQIQCQAQGVGCGLINGNVPKAKRAPIIELFKQGGYQVLAATIATLSEAVNLQNASVVIMLEESYDPIDNEQAIARVVRQGQPAHVSVHLIRAKDTVDELEVLPAYMTKREVRRLVLGTR